MTTLPAARIAFLVALVACVSACSDDDENAHASAQQHGFDETEVRTTIARVADWALENPQPFDVRYWVMAPLYDGMIDASLATGDPRYLAAVIRAGQRSLFESGSRTYHADGHAAGRSWLRIYLLDPNRDPEFLEPFRELFDRIVSDPILEDLRFGRSPPAGLRITDRWTWADALYMSPPTIVVLSQATGDPRYLDFMDFEYRFAYDGLYDKEEHLFYRDARYIDQRTPNGEKLFWSRGNGWVYAGLGLVLDSLPPDWPTRPFYVQLFQEMSEALRSVQQPDGFWYPSLKDPKHIASRETSGTAFFVMGMASGIRQGLIDPEVYWPVVLRGWQAIRSIVDEEGAVNFVQPIGDLPEPFDPESRVPYGTGAVLSAGWQILQALGETAPVDGATLFTQAAPLVPTAPDLSSVCEDPCGKPGPVEPP